MKRLFSNRIINAIYVIVFALFITGCGSSESFVSTWPDEAIQIDGSRQDWQGNLKNFPEGNYSVGFKNDNKYLYLCFITADRGKIQSIMRSGLNVAFESQTDERKNYKIQFPVIGPDSQRGPQGEFIPGQPGRGNMEPPVNKEGVGAPLQGMLDKQIQFNLIEKDYVNPLPFKNKENIEIKMSLEKEILIYELKVPLETAKSSFPIGAMPGDKIKIKFETETPKMAARGGAGGRNASGQQPGGNPPAGGGQDELGGPVPGPGGTGGPGGMRGGRGQGMGNLSAKTAENLSLTFEVQLIKEAIKN